LQIPVLNFEFLVLSWKERIRRCQLKIKNQKLKTLYSPRQFPDEPFGHELFRPHPADAWRRNAA
jgi:hypothetical protein